MNGYPFAEESLTSEFVSGQRVLVLKRAAALSKDGFMVLDEGPRTALCSDQRVLVLKRAAALSKDVSLILDEPRTASFSIIVSAVLAIT